MSDIESYSEYYALNAEGHRIGLCICRTCGATVLLGDPQCDAPLIHSRWHDCFTLKVENPPKQKRGKR